MDENGRFSRIEYACGCKTVSKAPRHTDAGTWRYLERCKEHAGKLSVVILREPVPPWWWGA
jgi:hypothetical protein